MKKLFYIIGIVCISVLCFIGGYAYSQCRQSAAKISSDASDISVDTSLLESKYYEKMEKIDGTKLYIPDEGDFSIQLPKDAALSANIEEFGGRLSCSSSQGSLAVRIDEDRVYTPVTESKLQESYSAMFYGEAKENRIIDYKTFTDENGNEIGRSYTVANENHKLIYLRDLKYRDNTIRVIGQPSLNDENSIKAFVDSFVLFDN
ncbi:MAG: hypothetical protein Q4G33_13475 [bacterium]|nr:hypothetical protein [bacterium]